mmetsp:Transcript_14594/g.18036  ORF Transcript_14594/g.18036 Transcript_14594/m.18036 type:complete len:91 (+) Transcript_14594:235-507(+)|eukprot:CAMPEP_0204881374 /NCGR_PEP_ID=MMETSP1349-20130617/2629_1 /ASSEMBLY_ACC=CAM_ASM_000710 /TAXON_ID=215587 /ORGANISM="Aplanochytrium stocchinoi, Strain GSBS06" /LENGTH=90 /DNA_ID=CAMNT_0052040271 /DNA_START=205 /DNA_END=477 /DNA_ORIENTATION=-
MMAEMDNSDDVLSLLVRFLRLVENTEYAKAQDIAKQVLLLEPENETILKFQPLLSQAQTVLLKREDDFVEEGHESDNESSDSDEGVEGKF